MVDGRKLRCIWFFYAALVSLDITDMDVGTNAQNTRASYLQNLIFLIQT